MTPDITGATKIIALLADPVGHVRAQLTFNSLFVEKDVDAILVPFNVAGDDLLAAFELAKRATNVAGLLLTIPHKVAMAELCDELGPHAQLVGAVNAVRFEGDRAIGEIYDGIGLVSAAHSRGITFAGRRVLIVGTGGAGTAVAAAIASEQPSMLTLSNRTESKAVDVAERLSSICPTDIGAPEGRQHDVVVNCTSVGMRDDDPLPIDLDEMAPSAAVIDIIANPEWTAVRRRAADAGHSTMGGVPMIEHQISLLGNHFLPGVELT
jgi:shikimate dehydrogenase